MNNTKIDLFSLPLISQYRALLWYGDADGTTLTPNFDTGSIQDRTLVIKSVRLFPYAATAIIDFYVNDGTVSNSETLPIGARLTRVIDNFNLGARIDFKINGTPVGLFPSDADGGYPIDLFVDNIYFHYSEKVQTFEVAITGDVLDDIEANTTQTPSIKVLVECYIL